MNKKSIPVKLDKVWKVFKDPQAKKDVVAVENADFTIQPGELVTLLGPSGCGKTTTLRMIAGFELPTQGKILIGDSDVTYLAPNQRDTAMVFQSYGLFPHMNVFENVAYGLKIRKVPKDEIKKKVTEFLGLVGLENLAQRSPSRLSGGQQQRVALARSLIVEPSVLLLDEPLSNLDALLREQMRVEIRRLQKSLGITAVYVTHDRVEAMSLSDKIIVMNSGKIVQIGPPHEIYRNPVSKFVAGFIGKVAFFQAQVMEVSDKCTVKINDGVYTISSFDSSLKPGDRSVIMCRPEALTLSEPKKGLIDGTVVTNVYLGNSVESFVNTDIGEVLVQIDNPAEKRIFKEGERVSVTFLPNLTKVLKDS
ncbi:MAG TPA: ABC transporter ATP-binding protein [Petrotogaceae bacterium]|jgi:iron(III) transport system ATP-binding protein|nr:ABC transporter ATP-binding protein [Petrotogaceae bacterium]HNY36565.1 ABC transporter ATP-binding protein [Petrotogaceae bacterium]HOG33493.1 ABC transporter ATP-binding protein [Petrotogaceae bacterium]HOT31035.1 ABC transporter ATP-binding protein [Petrotogaceae bacterium]HPA93707.1 ABC transporter ATP-binding protein [Petrotogaceae bacterium]